MNKTDTVKIRKVPFIFLLVGGTLLLAGLAAGEHIRVLEQAVSICLSCIGIG